jgi:predicted CoA-substrate-specific enzyme activase
MNRYTGISLGASTITLCTREGSKIEYNRITHGGNPKGAFENLDNKSMGSICVTGRKFKEQLSYKGISEPEAVQYGYSFVREKYPNINVILSGGGETFIQYLLDSEGQITAVHTGNKCASGTGEFFLQQIKRMNLGIEEAMDISKEKTPYKVAQRCSVFCKSDCTHALNKGMDKGDVVAGLSQMMAGKLMELLSKVEPKGILLIGGITQNPSVVKYLKKDYPDLVIPEEALYFEALGASIYIERHNDLMDEIKKEKAAYSFDFYRPLREYSHMVEFHTLNLGTPSLGEKCIIGLDIGSTTTKAVLMGVEKEKIYGKVYIRTNGDPIAAARECYKSLNDQFAGNIKIVGLGVTGSGRYIAGLHGKTKGIVNEIIAHATGAVHYNQKVDTILEIGGQDAKYTYITNGVPTDYAMNEACSAGTGSFLEEACKESLNIETNEIGDIALEGNNPPNFNDQCSAFISSDIKTAIQEGLSMANIVTGLVYSICLNYINRVKGSRKLGNFIFMQGGICYNKAVPLAMAAITGKKIIVPPEPGLMGAMGVALELKKRIKKGLIKEDTFNLEELANREAVYGKSFICRGTKEGCDRKCKINQIIIGKEKIPFGGICNKYYNLKDNANISAVDYISFRESQYFNMALDKPIIKQPIKIGINRSLMTHTYYPLFYNFFTKLEYEVVLSDNVNDKGLDRKGSSFCYPVELAHGYFLDLIEKKSDYIFVPHIRSYYVENGYRVASVCPTIQGESYLLKAAFKRELGNIKILNPVLDFQKGYMENEDEFVEIAKALGSNPKDGEIAYRYSLEKFLSLERDEKALGKKILRELKDDEIAIVIFGRSYNAYDKSANMGIPKKFSSRGIKVIPYHYLPLDDVPPRKGMYWGCGQELLKGAEIVKRSPNLYGVYITNFSCGPDSFLLNYFRNIMGDKPSLTLELDSHTADAGIDTRIEAFLDIVKLNGKNLGGFSEVAVSLENNQGLTNIEGKPVELKDSNTIVLIPSMGAYGSRALANVFLSEGVNAMALPLPGLEELNMGKVFTTCKECLPMILTLGSLIKYVKEVPDPNKQVVYFMPETDGPCRFGQYNQLMKEILLKEGIGNVSFLSLSADNGYGGMSVNFAIKALNATIISDVLDDMYGAVYTLAKNRKFALNILEKVSNRIIEGLKDRSLKEIYNLCKESAIDIKGIPLKGNFEKAPKVSLNGEIYVRKDPFARQYLVEKMAEKGIILRSAPILEWLNYTDYLVTRGISRQSNFSNKLKSHIKSLGAGYFERKIKRIFASSGLYEFHKENIKEVVDKGSSVLNTALTGEGILTIGATIKDIGTSNAGVIAIGPFGCMPNRIAEAILNYELIDEKKKEGGKIKAMLEANPYLPFLVIETDGNPFPQVIEARLESFILQVKSFHKKTQI